MKHNQKDWYEHDLWVGIPDRVVALELTPQGVLSRILWLESIIKAGDADYERLASEIGQIEALVKDNKSRTVIYDGGYWSITALRALVKFSKEWSARRWEYAEQLKPLYALYATYPENTRTSNTGVKRQTRNKKSGSK